jgi:hypothetical protein
MAGVVVREFFALLGLDVDKKDFEQGEQALQNIGNLLKLLVAGAGVAAGAIGLLTRQFVRQALDLDQWNKRTGESVERLHALQIASEQLGVDPRKTFEGFSELADKVSDVVKNIKKLEGSDAAEALRNLGFKSISELKGVDGAVRPIPELFDEVLTRLAGIENQGLRTGLAMQLFGDDTGLALAALDIEQLRAFRDEALALELVMGKEDVEAAKRFQGAFRGAVATIQAMLGSGIAPLLGHLTRVARLTQQWVVANREIIRQRLDRVGRAIGEAFRFLALKFRDYLGVAGDVIDSLSGIERLLKLVGTAVALYLTLQVGTVLVNAFNSAVKAIQAFNFWLTVMKSVMYAEAIIVGILAGVIFLFVDELITRLKGGETVIDDFLNSKKISPDDNVFIKAIRAIILSVGLAVKAISDLWTLIREGPTSEIGQKALKDIQDNIRIALSLDRFTDQKKVARFLEGLPFEQPDKVEPLLPLIDVPSSTAPSVSPRGGNTTSISIVGGPVNVQVGSGDPNEIAGAVGREVDARNKRAIEEARRKLAGGF